MKLTNLGPDSVVCKRLFDLTCDVAIHVTEAIEKQRQQDYHERSDTDDEPGEDGVPAREITPALCDRSLWWLRALG